MPNINLRLTDEEHEALRKWAHGSRRSLQREIIFRLFSDGRLPERGGAKPVPGSVTEPGSRRNTDERLADLGSRSLDVPRSGSCPMQPPRGTKCKVCGKVHPV